MRTDVSERVYRLGRGPIWHHKRVGFGVVSQAASARLPKLHPNDGVLRWEMRWQCVFMVFSNCLWVEKGRTDVSERVYRLGRGPTWHHKRVRFGVVSQAARLPDRPNFSQTMGYCDG